MSVRTLDKLRQPSTWAGLGLLWSLFGPKAVPWEIVVNAITAVAALLAILLNENGNGAPR